MAMDPVWTPFHARLHQVLRDRHLIQRDQSLLVAVSGGQDSLCLARLLLDLQSRWRWRVAIAHCNHRWRADSDANAEHVRGLAAQWGVTYFEAIAPQDLAQTEAAARDWRYQALEKLAAEQGFERVVTGHTASDRAETLLYNLLRGCGSDGLHALRWRRSLGGCELIRPLLSVTRAETAEFCRLRRLPIWQDCTNLDFKYARNRIRHELMPYLQQHFNPQVEQVLAQTAELLQGEGEEWERVEGEWWGRVGGREEEEGKEKKEGGREEEEGRRKREEGKEEKGGGRVNRVGLRGAGLAVRRRVVRRWLREVLGVGIGFEQVEQVVGLVDAPNRSRTAPLPGGAIAQVQGDWICLVSPID